MTKGRDAEWAAADVYQYAGYETYLPPKAKYREQDVFGLFDVLAFKQGRLEGCQVKGGQNASGINSWFADVVNFEEAIEGVTVSFWHLKEDSWRIARPAPDGYQWVYDGRKDDSPEVFNVI